jgi:hypothetical protein
MAARSQPPVSYLPTPLLGENTPILNDDRLMAGSGSTRKRLSVRMYSSY